MPSNAGATALLNQATGKKSPRKTKPRAVDVNELQFSPEKGSVDQAGSKRKRRLSVQQHDAVRNPFPLAAHGEAQPDFTPVPKRQRKLRKDAGVDPSPLKKLGYNPQEAHVAKVNLNESPRKGARAKRSQDKAAQLAFNEEKRRQMNSKRKTRLSVTQGLHDAPPSTWDEAQEVAAAAAAPAAGEKQANEEDNVEQQDAEPTTQHPPSRQTEDDGVAESEHSEDEEEARADRDGTDEVHDVEQAQNTDLQHETAGPSGDEQQHQTGERSVRQKRRKVRKKVRKSVVEYEQEEEDEHERLRQAYMAGIEDVAGVYDCYSDWRKAGGVGRRLREMFADTIPGSRIGRAFQRRFDELTEQFRQLRRGKADAETSHAAAAFVIAKINGLCMGAETAARERSRIVQDLYRHTIPGIVGVLKSFLKVHAGETSFDSDALKEAVDLLRLADSICGLAVGWDPRPTTLEPHVLRWVRRELAPAVSAILQRFESEYRYFKHQQQEKIRLAELVQKQNECSQRLARRREEKYARGSIALRRGRATQLQSVNHADIIDIDDAVAAPSGGRPRGERQATEDIPPRLPISWTETEQAALLNGLQNHRGSGRFWKILEDNDVVLKDRTVDDLQAAALYFKEVYMTALEFRHMEKEQFSWIVSVGTESAMAQTELMA